MAKSNYVKKTKTKGHKKVQAPRQESPRAFYNTYADEEELKTGVFKRHRQNHVQTEFADHEEFGVVRKIHTDGMVVVDLYPGYGQFQRKAIFNIKNTSLVNIITLGSIVKGYISDKITQIYTMKNIECHEI